MNPGPEIKMLREGLHLSTYELAKELQMREVYLVQIEDEDIIPPTLTAQRCIRHLKGLYETYGMPLPDPTRLDQLEQIISTQGRLALMVGSIGMLALVVLGVIALTLELP
jgi:DNA-binding XRE family transcriptional regulator